MVRENCRLSKDDSSENDKVWASRSKNRAAEAEIKSKEDEEKSRQGESQPNIAPVCVFILVPVSFGAVVIVGSLQPQFHLQVIRLTSTEPRAKAD